MWVPGTYLSVISKDVWDHVLVPCITFRVVDPYQGVTAWVEGGIRERAYYITFLPPQYDGRRRRQLIG